MPEYAVIGKSVVRTDGNEKVTGATRYTGDLQISGLLHARLILSPHANARVVHIDGDEARGVPGVVAVLTAEDLPLRPDPTSRKRDFLARGQAVYCGHPVAAVLAETAAAAEDAVPLVVVEYDPGDATLDPLRAMELGAPPVRPRETPGFDKQSALGTPSAGGGDSKAAGEGLSTNVASTQHFSRGDIEAGFREAAAIVEKTYRTSRVHQGYIEPQVAVAIPDPLGSLTIYTSTQALFTTRKEVCEALGLPNGKVNVVAMTIGGGFGGKSTLIEALCAALALKAGRPVRLEYTRMDDFLAACPAPPALVELKVGADQNGSLTALQARVVLDTGAYSGTPVLNSCIVLGGFYKVPNVDIRGYEVLTNKTPAGSYRAPGGIQAIFALESTIDLLAAELGIDRLAIRTRNAAEEGDPRGNEVPWPRIGLRECLAKIEEPLERLRQAKRHHGSVRQGVGLAIGGWQGAIEPASAVCRLNHDGTITVVIGSVDISGTDTGFALIAAEAFGVRADQVQVVRADSDNAPYAGNSGGSKITYTVGAAVQRAATDARGQLLRIASQHLEASIDDLELQDGEIRVRGVPDRRASVTDLAAASMSFGGKYEPVYGRGSSAQRIQSPALAAHAARVAVDTDTGYVKVLEYVAVQDVGQAINPAELEGQIQGGVLQGLSWALFEQMAYDEQGGLITGSLMDYVLPSASQAPTITPILVEVPSLWGPFGARGVGEPPIVPCAGTIANAIADACGARVTEIPITPPAILAQLHQARGRNGH